MINLICALKCEAKPLITYLKLTHYAKSDIFPVYRDEQNLYSLVITQPGKINAAAGTCYVHTLLNTVRSDAWLNIGVAGHKSLALGEVVLANRIEDLANDNIYYPQLVFKPPCKTAELCTLDRPSSKYKEVMFDMEASGFYATAIRFGSAELIHSLKIISDNNKYPKNNINKTFVEELITEKLDDINLLINELQQISSSVETLKKEPEFYLKCLSKWHFTQYEKNTLYRMLRRWKHVCPDDDPIVTFGYLKNAKDLLSSLEIKMDQTPFQLTSE